MWWKSWGHLRYSDSQKYHLVQTDPANLSPISQQMTAHSKELYRILDFSLSLQFIFIDQL